MKEKEDIESGPEEKEDGKFKRVEGKVKKTEKELKKMENKKSKSKWIQLVIILSIILVVGFVFSTIFALINMNNDKIMGGISISGIEVSGLTKEEAKSKMDIIYNEKKEKEINIKYQDYESTLSPALMEVEYDVEKAVNEAYTVGREDNIFVNNYKILNSLITKKDIIVDLSLNEEVAKQSINDINVNLPGVVVESTYSVEDNELIISKGKAGINVDADKLLEKVKEKLNTLDLKEEYIEIPVRFVEPKTIDIDQIHEEIYKEAKDAYYTKEPFAVYPEVDGVDFNVEEAKKLLEEEKDEYVIKLNITKPKIKLDQIGSEAFPDRLSHYTSRYDAGNRDRTTNLVLACGKLDGKVIMPGEVFSYNKTLGPRTVAAGYKNAKIYAGGEVVDGLGGGICQISSTLYNAVLMANMEIVERRNHQFVATYVPIGRDATVVYGSQDFKFKNTRKYPIRIKASVQSGVASIAIYGIKEETEYTFSFNTQTISTVPFATKYIEDSSLPAGTEKVKQHGANGVKTETYITKMLNGKVVSKKLLSRDTYNPMTRIVIKGTKGGVPATPEKPEKPTVPATPEKPEVPAEPQTPTKPEVPEKPTTPAGTEKPVN